MSRFEVRKGPWSGLFDVNFMALGDQTNLPLGGQIDVDIESPLILARNKYGATVKCQVSELRAEAD